jgi:hypothetical protein
MSKEPGSSTFFPFSQLPAPLCKLAVVRIALNLLRAPATHFSSLA